MSIRFMKYYVTDSSKRRARVYYSHGMMTDGIEAVTLYAKDYESGQILAEIFENTGGYKNDTDIMTDYFEKGRVRINKGAPLFELALKRCNGR